jgi:hypothetical protein
MKRLINLVAIAGLPSAAFAQGVTLSFSADRAVAVRGETIHWTVNASFTGYEDPTAYFAGFIGVFYADDETVGTAMNTMCHMLQADDPIISGATIGNVDILCWSGLGNNDPANPRLIYEFDVDVTAFRGSLAYEPVGVASVFPNDEWMVMPEDYTDFSINSDTVTIGFGCGDADLDEPWGVLDSADITMFVTMFLAEDGAVDYDANGVFDLVDIVHFVTAFTDGCP